MDAGGEQVRRSAPSKTGANGYAVTQAFGQGHDVRDNAFVLEREPLAGAADAGLDFVEHQQPRAPVAEFADSLEVTGRGQLHTAFALDRLHQDRHDAWAMGLLHGVQGLEITERHFDEISRQLIETQAYRRAV